MTWWQSEAGVDHVSIQLDLERTFRLNYVNISFTGPRPAAMYIERSNDFGKTWTAYRYFAEDCRSSFRNIALRASSLTDVYCEQNLPSNRPQLLEFRVMGKNSSVDYSFLKDVQYVLITNIRIVFTKLQRPVSNYVSDSGKVSMVCWVPSSFGSMIPLPPQRQSFYAIREMIIRGSCFCHGHAPRCSLLNDIEGSIGSCLCAHNTKGDECESCQDLYGDVPWRPAYKNRNGNVCKSKRNGDHRRIINECAAGNMIDCVCQNASATDTRTVATMTK